MPATHSGSLSNSTEIVKPEIKHKTKRQNLSSEEFVKDRVRIKWEMCGLRFEDWGIWSDGFFIVSDYLLCCNNIAGNRLAGQDRFRF